MEKFRGKAALVTGAASGIGAAVSRKLVLLGMTVYGCDLDGDGLMRIDKEFHVTQTPEPEVGLSDDKPKEFSVVGHFVPVVCDLRKEDEIASMFRLIEKQCGCATVCVMSAGVGHKASVLQGDSSAYRDMFDVNVLGCVLCTQTAVRLMRASGTEDGHLILINSLAGHSVRVGKPDYADFNFYNATKYALTAITEGLRYELRLSKSKIRVSQISPGLVETNFTHRMYPDEGHIIDMLYQCTVTLKPEDVAEAVMHALSRPPHVQVHDILMSANGPDRPADWEKRTAAEASSKLPVAD